MPKTYNEKDIQVLKSAADAIRRKPEMFAGPKPWARTLSEKIVKDFLLLGAMPVDVENVDGWWIVYAGQDKMIGPDGKLSLDHFNDLRHYPGAGINSCKIGPVVAALCDAVVTTGLDGTTWITGKGSEWDIPVQLQQVRPGFENGRSIAFTIRDEA